MLRLSVAKPINSGQAANALMINRDAGNLAFDANGDAAFAAADSTFEHGHNAATHQHRGTDSGIQRDA